MPSDYKRISDENVRKYGTDIGRYGAVLLANRYSERTHFVYELLQNAEDAGARYVRFHLFRDRLEVTHNGRLFNDDDVRGICGLVEGTKASDLTQIGKFGIGFKSVYAYTRSPEVHSGDEHFAICDYVHPAAITPKQIPNHETLFVFPFNHQDVTEAGASQEIGNRLRSLGARTLLFLRNIEEINWVLQEGPSGAYLRESRRDGQARRVFVIGQDEDGETSEEWLVLERPVGTAEDGELRVEIAFLLQEEETTEKERIVPVQPSHLVAFFPTEKETHLKFLLQGPYRTTPARDNVPRIDKWNRDLVTATAGLLADTLKTVRDMRLLTVTFLEMLPLSSEDFPEDAMFRPVFEEVSDALQKEELLPTDIGGLISAKRAKLARGAALIDLLSDDQLRILYSAKEPIAWLSRDITQDRTPVLRAYLLDDLGVEEVAPEDFARNVSLTFIEKQSDEWVIRLYRFLSNQRALWRAADNAWMNGPIRSKPFVRREDGSHVAPFDVDGHPTAYLPPEADTRFPTVKRTVAEDEGALEFLRSLGLQEPDAVAEVIEYVLPKYHKPEEYTVSDDEYRRDTQKIIRALKKAPQGRRQELVEILQETPFLRAMNAATGKGRFKKPGEIYFRSSELEMYFEGNAAAWFLDEVRDLADGQLLHLGVDDKVYVERVAQNYQGHVTIANSWGRHVRGLSGFDPDCWIDGLEHALSHPTREKAAYVWNALLLPNVDCIRGTVESSSRQTYEDLKKEKKSSQMGQIATGNVWLPNQSGDFHKPSDLSLDDLPDEFRRDEHLAKQLGMKPTSLSSLAREVGLEPEDLDVLRRHPDEFKELVEALRSKEGSHADQEEELEERREGAVLNFGEALEGAFARPGTKEQRSFVPPSEPVVDPETRRNKTKDEIERKIRQEPAREQRFKKVSTRQWEAKDNQARTFLREQYRGKCQVCGYAFAKRNREPYFEGLYLVSYTRARWIDRSGNVLCLCANCCAKFQHGEVVAEDVRHQIEAFRTAKEGGHSPLMLRVRLCGEDVRIEFSERHAIDLQEMLRASQDGGAQGGPGQQGSGSEPLENTGKDSNTGQSD